MTSLKTRKQLLIAESEINRQLLVRDFRMLSHGIQGLTHEVSRYGGYLTSLAALATVVSIFRRPKPAVPKKTAWLDYIVKAVRIGVSLWPMLSTKRRPAAAPSPEKVPA